MVNDTLVKKCAEVLDYKYWHLGMVESLELHFARILNADFHLGFPDVVYSDSHFAGILHALRRSGHKVITKGWA